MLGPARVGWVGGVVFAVGALAATWVFGPVAGLLMVPFAMAAVALPRLADLVSLARGWLAIPAAALVMQQNFRAALLLGALAGLTDFIDGRLARLRGEVTQVGAALDPLCDGVLFVALAYALTVVGLVDGLGVGMIAARYALPALAVAGLYLAGRRLSLQHTPLGRLSTAVICVGLGAVWIAAGIGYRIGPWVEVIIIVLSLAALANLAWAAYHQLRASSAPALTASVPPEAESSGGLADREA